jgi:hypothetical protein
MPPKLQPAPPLLNRPPVFFLANPLPNPALVFPLQPCAASATRVAEGKVFAAPARALLPTALSLRRLPLAPFPARLALRGSSPRCAFRVCSGAAGAGALAPVMRRGHAVPVQYTPFVLRSGA